MATALIGASAPAAAQDATGPRPNPPHQPPASPADAAAPPAPPLRVPPMEAARGSELPAAGCVVGGALIALGLGTAIATGVLLAEDDRPGDSECADGRCTMTREEALLVVHFAGWGLATTGVVLGTTLVLAGTASDERTLPAATVAIVPRGFPGGGGLGMNGRF